MAGTIKRMVARVAKSLAVLPWSIELKPWMFSFQLKSPTDDGNPDENREYNCAETALSQILTFLFGWDFESFGPIILPDDIKDQIRPGETNIGPTTIQQIQDYLKNEWGVNSTSYTATSSANLLWREWTYLSQGKPLLALRYWRYRGDQYLHWVTVIGQDPQNVVIANPEPLDPMTKVPLPNPTPDQGRQVESYAAHTAMSTLILIGIDGIDDTLLATPKGTS